MFVGFVECEFAERSGDGIERQVHRQNLADLGFGQVQNGHGCTLEPQAVISLPASQSFSLREAAFDHLAARGERHPHEALGPERGPGHEVHVRLFQK